MEKLTTRELEVADLIHLGNSEKDIALRLFISTNTVHTHSKNIKRKLNAKNIADITRIFLLQLKPYSIAIIIAIILSILYLHNPELFDDLKTSLINTLN